VRYLSPAFLLTIFALWLAVNVLGLRFDDGPARLSGYIVDLFVQPNPIAWMSVALIGLVLGFVVALIANARLYRKPVAEMTPSVPPTSLKP
jgi:membrane associated rhomboid family serine protease